jgi:hypothetical protein
VGVGGVAGVASGSSVVGGGPRHCSRVEEMWWRPNVVEYERHDSSSNSRCGRIGVGEVQVGSSGPLSGSSGYRQR